MVRWRFADAVFGKGHARELALTFELAGGHLSGKKCLRGNLIRFVWTRTWMVKFACSAIIQLPADVYFTERDTDAFRKLQGKVDLCGLVGLRDFLGAEIGGFGYSGRLERRRGAAHCPPCDTAEYAKVCAHCSKEAVRVC